MSNYLNYRLPEFPNIPIGYTIIGLVALIAVIYLIISIVRERRSKTQEELNKEKAKQDIKDWAKTLLEIDSKIRDLYKKLNEVYKEIN